MRGHRPLSISRASSYSPLFSKSLASLQHSSARPPTSRFGFTNSRKSEARNVIVRKKRPSLNCALTLTQFFLRLQEKCLVWVDVKNFVSLLGSQNSEFLGGYKIVNKLQRTCAVAIVATVLAVPAFGGQLDSPGVVGTIDSPGITGIIDSPGVVAPPPPSQTTSTSTSSTITMILTVLSLIRS